MRPIVMSLAVCGAMAVQARAQVPQTCPFERPVVTLPPQEVNGFVWRGPIRPLDDPCVKGIDFDPVDDSTWYVVGQNGLYVTKNAGRTWTHPLTGFSRPLAQTRFGERVYVGIKQSLYLSRDRGTKWTLVGTYPSVVTAVLPTPEGRLYVAYSQNDHVQPSGVVVSDLDGRRAAFKPFGQGQTGLIVWALARDPKDGTLYAGTEIFDHPRPYKPPFFRSKDRGETWMDMTGSLPGHITDLAVRPADGFLYAKAEAWGLFGSPDQGVTWRFLSLEPRFALLMDPETPHRLYGGNFAGAFLSEDGGRSFQPILKGGPVGDSFSGAVGDFALNADRTVLFATIYASGIYVAAVPPRLAP